MKKSSKSLSALALQKFRKNTTGVFSFWFIVCIGCIAVFAYLIAPDNSSNANQMHLEIHSQPPGFEVLMISIPPDSIVKQSFMNALIYGAKNKDKKIPINSYERLGR